MNGPKLMDALRAAIYGDTEEAFLADRDDALAVIYGVPRICGMGRHAGAPLDAEAGDSSVSVDSEYRKLARQLVDEADADGVGHDRLLELVNNALTVWYSTPQGRVEEELMDLIIRSIQLRGQIDRYAGTADG